MYLAVTGGRPTFLNRSQWLFETLQKDIPLKNKLYRDFNFDDQRLERSFSLHAQARLAEIEYANATKSLPEMKKIFEKWHDEAVVTFCMHKAFLQVALRYNPQKQLDLGIIGREEAKTTFEWLDNTLNSYQRLLDDAETMGLLARYNVAEQDFVNGKAVVIEFRNAYLAMTINHPQVKLAMNKKDEAFLELEDNVSEIQAVLLQIFKKDPKHLKRLKLPIVIDEIGQVIMISMVKDSSIT